MKTKVKVRLLVAVLAMAVLSFTVVSCCKKDNECPNGTTQLTKEQVAQKNLKRILKKLPKTYKVNGKEVKLTKDGFSFTNPNGGFNYSTNTGVHYSEESHTVFISANSLGANAGGTVIAGTSSLDVNYTFCMSASDSALGFNFFGPEFTGVSLVFGIAGDMEALMNNQNNNNNNEEPDFTDYFQGIAEYIVYADQANGSYEILNWLTDLNNEDPDMLADKGFAIVIDFVNNKLYLSLEGTLNVSGGSISFNGNYLAVGAFDAYNPDGTEEITYEIVNGFGTMGCN